MPTPKNRNYLSGINFKFNIARCPHVEFFIQSVTTPDLRLGTAQQGTAFNILKLPGDELMYGDLVIKFIIDEDLRNYNEISQWIRFMANPDGDNFCSSEYIQKYGEDFLSDASLFTLNSNFNTNCLMVFKHIYPVYLSGIMFDSSYADEQFLSAECNFKVNVVDIIDKDGNKMWLKV